MNLVRSWLIKISKREGRVVVGEHGDERILLHVVGEDGGCGGWGVVSEPSHGFVEEGVFGVWVVGFGAVFGGEFPSVAVAVFFDFAVDADEEDAAGVVGAGDDGGVAGDLKGA